MELLSIDILLVSDWNLRFQYNRHILLNKIFYCQSPFPLLLNYLFYLFYLLSLRLMRHWKRQVWFENDTLRTTNFYYKIFVIFIPMLAGSDLLLEDRLVFICNILIVFNFWRKWSWKSLMRTFFLLSKVVLTKLKSITDVKMRFEKNYPK